MLAQSEAVSSDTTSSTPTTPGQRLLVSLASELCVVLQASERWVDLANFLDEANPYSVVAAAKICPAVATLDNVLVSRVYVSLRVEVRTPAALLSCCSFVVLSFLFPSIFTLVSLYLFFGSQS